MCYYETPVIQWLLCGHTRTVAAVRRYCDLPQDLATPPSSHAPLPEACMAPVYFARTICFDAFCPSCEWTSYNCRLDQAIAHHGPEVYPLVPKPPYLIPLYRVCAQPELSGFIGFAPTPREFIDDLRRARATRIAEWVQQQTQYQYEAVQRNSLYAIEGATIENMPPGWLERTSTRWTVPPRAPTNQEARNARSESGKERPSPWGVGEGWRD